MAQGDTTVRIDFEVGGANDAKMRILDIYNASKKKQEELKNATKAFSQATGISYGDAMKSVRKFRTEVEQAAREQARLEAKPKPLTEEEKAQLKAAKDLEAERRFWRRKNLVEAHNDQRRMDREASVERKRALREEAREARRIRRQEEAEARRAGGRGLGERLLGRTGNAALMGVAGYAGVAGIGSIVSGITQSIQGIIDKRTELEKAITPLVMLEDNVSRMGEIRSEVTATAVGLKRTYDEVGKFYADVVGSTGNLTSSEREQLIKETKELADLTGGSLVTAQDMLTKSYQIYRKELGSVNELQNKLMETQDQGSISFEEMALRIPEALQVGKFADMGIDEVLAAIIAMTRESGSIEKSMTGLRNVLLIMEEAPKKGIKLTGDYMNKMEQLRDEFTKNKAKMQELFGREAIVHAVSMVNTIDQQKEAMKSLASATGEQDSVMQKLLEKYNDPAFAQVSRMNAYQAAGENAPNVAPDILAGSVGGELIEILRAGALNWKVSTGGFGGDWLANTFGSFGGLINPDFANFGYAHMKNSLETPEFLMQGRREFFMKKERDLANANRIGSDEERERKIADITSRQLPMTFMTDIERDMYRQTGAGPQSAEIASGAKMASSIDEQNRYLKRLVEIGERQEKEKAKTKPGGSRSNYEEAI